MLIINLTPLKTTKYKLKYYKLRKCNTLTRMNSDIMQLIQVSSIITKVVFLNSNKHNNIIYFQFTLKYVL